MLNFDAEDFVFARDGRPGRANGKSGDRLKHLAWIIPLFVILLIGGLCVDYALQSRDRQDLTAETYMQELEGRVLRALTWSTYVPSPERDETLPPNDPLLRLIAPDIEAELRALEPPKTKPGKNPAEASAGPGGGAGQDQAAFAFLRFAEQIAAARAADQGAPPAASAEPQGAPSPDRAAPAVRRGGATGGGSTFGAGSGCRVVDGVRRC